MRQYSRSGLEHQRDKECPKRKAKNKVKVLKISYCIKYREGKKTVERHRVDALEEG
jgi:hypothetical protein